MLNLLYYLIIFVFLLLIICSIATVLYMIFSLINKVPFICSPEKILEDISKEFDIRDGDVIYDLGCGNGNVLFYLAKKNTKAKYIGVENNPLPVIMAKIKKFFVKKEVGNAVSIINKDFNKINLSNADYIFTYLFPEIMDNLLPKFNKELKSGAKVISLSFEFSGKAPTKKVDLKRKKYQLGQKIYVYEF